MLTKERKNGLSGNTVDEMETKVTTKREGKGRKRLYVPQDRFGQETAD